MSQMASATRNQILSIFKRLQRSKDHVFSGDLAALNAARNKIREEFSKHKHENDPVKITELLKVASESEELLRTKVIQAEETKPLIYRLRGDHLQEKCVGARERCADCTCGW